jgi:dTDP-4-amino-4,6-dideoxygalactose transaminase
MNYPLLTGSPVDKKPLFGQQVFIPTLWQDVPDRNMAGYDTEKHLATHLLPLPVDHRLTTEDLDRMIAAIMEIVL